MVREGRVLISTAGRPAFGSGFFVTAYEVGAVASVGSSGTTVTVDAGHGFAAGDKYMKSDGSSYSGTLTVQSVTATTLELSANYPVAQGEIIVNLGADTGMSAPDYNGSGATIYTDMDYSNVAVDATVMTTDTGRYIYWHRIVPRWELVRSSSGAPFAVYMDSTFLSESYANLFATSGDGSAANPWVGWEAALAANTTVRLPNGYYQSTSSVTVPAGCSIIGNGNLSRVVFVQSGNIGFVNAANAGNIVLRDFYIDHDGDTASSTNACIQFTTGTGQNYLFENLFINDAAHSGIRIVGSPGVATNVKVVGCTVDGAERHGIEFSSDVTEGLISGCYCEGTNTVTLGAAIYAGSIASAANITVIGNLVKSCTDNGIRSAGTDVAITGNTVVSAGNDGIRLGGTRQACSGNTVRGAGGQGIKAEDYASITVTGNTCTGCTESGIQVRYSNSQPSHIAVTGNTSSGNTLHGIHLRGGEDIVVSGNQCDGNSGANVWAEAADSTTLTRVLISGNYLYKPLGAKGNILISQTGASPGTIGYVHVVGNLCDGGGTAPYGIGVLHVGSGVSLIDNISQNHSGGANFSLVVGCYLRHAGPGTGNNATSTPVKGSMWMQTDGAGTRDTLQVFDGAAWRYALATPTTGEIVVVDGITAPTATAGSAKLFVDTADGDLKIIFGDGMVKTIVVDT